jgi:uncharacterized integral membrane protein
MKLFILALIIALSGCLMDIWIYLHRDHPFFVLACAVGCGAIAVFDIVMLALIDYDAGRRS